MWYGPRKLEALRSDLECCGRNDDCDTNGIGTREVRDDGCAAWAASRQTLRGETGSGSCRRDGRLGSHREVFGGVASGEPLTIGEGSDAGRAGRRMVLMYDACSWRMDARRTFPVRQCRGSLLQGRCVGRTHQPAMPTGGLARAPGVGARRARIGSSRTAAMDIRGRFNGDRHGARAPAQDPGPSR